MYKNYLIVCICTDSLFIQRCIEAALIICFLKVLGLAMVLSSEATKVSLTFFVKFRVDTFR